MKREKIVLSKEAKTKMLIIICIISIVVIAISTGVIIHATRRTSANVGQGEQDVQYNKNEEEPEEPTEAPEEPQDVDEENPEEGQPQEENPQTTTTEPKYYIKVNNQANVVTIYTKDANGQFTVPYKAMLCSIGTATPAAGNVYTIPGGTWDRWNWGQMVGGVWAQYYTRIHKSILFHSVPYTSKDKSKLEYWEYDKLGTKASAGCIRLTVEDAKWIYENCKPGTKVEFYESADPGPLGKPTARKIASEASYVRGWDPTDPDSKNPWKNYTGNPSQSQGNPNNGGSTVTPPVAQPTNPTPSVEPTPEPSPTPTPNPETPTNPDQGTTTDPTPGVTPQEPVDPTPNPDQQQTPEEQNPKPDENIEEPGTDEGGEDPGTNEGENEQSSDKVNT